MTCAPAKHFSPHGVELRKWVSRYFREFLIHGHRKQGHVTIRAAQKVLMTESCSKRGRGNNTSRNPTRVWMASCVKRIRASGMKCFTSPTCAGRWVWIGFVHHAQWRAFWHCLIAIFERFPPHFDHEGPTAYHFWHPSCLRPVLGYLQRGMKDGVKKEALCTRSWRNKIQTGTAEKRTRI